MIRRARAWLRRRRGWSRRRPLLAALLVVTAVAVPGYWRLEQTVDDVASTQAALADFVIVSAEASCQQRSDFRDVLVDLVKLSDDGTGLNLSGIPSFEAMPESVKTWVRELEARSSSAEDPSSFVDDALELLERVKCPDPTNLPGQESIR